MCYDPYMTICHESGKKEGAHPPRCCVTILYSLSLGTVLIWSTDEKVDEIKDDNRQTYVGVLDPLTGSLDTTLLTQFNHDMFCPGA